MSSPRGSREPVGGGRRDRDPPWDPGRVRAQRLRASPRTAARSHRCCRCFRLGLGGPLADGRAWWSWIVLDDVVRLILHAITHSEVAGAVNAVAPEPVRNLDFTRALARRLHRPALLPVPALALRLVFRGDGGRGPAGRASGASGAGAGSRGSSTSFRSSSGHSPMSSTGAHDRAEAGVRACTLTASRLRLRQRAHSTSASGCRDWSRSCSSDALRGLRRPRPRRPAEHRAPRQRRDRVHRTSSPAGQTR